MSACSALSSLWPGIQQAIDEHGASPATQLSLTSQATFSKEIAINKFSSPAGLAFIQRHRVFNQKNAALRGLFVSLAALVFLLMPVETKAQVATFEGETFQNGNLKTSTISCTPDGRGGGRIDFSVNGVATGPYAGTFNETGYVTFDALSAVTGGHILFEVKDALGITVTEKGAKVPLDGTAGCSVDTKTGMTTVKVNVSTLDYSVVVGGAGDSGKATLDLFASSDKSLGLTTLLFTEIFHSSNYVPSTFGKVTGGGNISQTAGGSGVTFGFNAQNTENLAIHRSTNHSRDVIILSHKVARNNHIEAGAYVRVQPPFSGSIDFTAPHGFACSLTNAAA